MGKIRFRDSRGREFVMQDVTVVVDDAMVEQAQRQWLSDESDAPDRVRAMLEAGLAPQPSWPDPTPEMQLRPAYAAVWNCIKAWDVSVPGAYAGYCGATGNHVRAILDALAAALPWKSQQVRMVGPAGSFGMITIEDLPTGLRADVPIWLAKMIVSCDPMAKLREAANQQRGVPMGFTESVSLMPDPFRMRTHVMDTAPASEDRRIRETSRRGPWTFHPKGGRKGAGRRKGDGR